MESGLGRIKKKSLSLMHIVDYGKSGSKFLAESSKLFSLVIGELKADFMESISS